MSDGLEFDAGTDEDPASSGRRVVSRRDMRKIFEARNEANRAVVAADAATAKAQRARRTLAAIVAAVLTTVTGTVSTLAFAQGRIDAGVAPVRAELELYKTSQGEALKRLELALDELKADSKAARKQENERWERLLWKLKVRDPSPEPKDSGP